MPGKAFFLDSSYIIALAQANDQHHRKAVEMAAMIEGENIALVTTRAVLLEIGSALARFRTRPDAIRLIEALQTSMQVEIVPLTEEIAAQAWNLFRQRADKEWSWTDCISFVVMTERKLSKALTSDQHFEQAGYDALLRQ